MLLHQDNLFGCFSYQTYKTKKQKTPCDMVLLLSLLSFGGNKALT
jgi:hypothetical protein